MSIKVCIDAGHYGKYNPSPVVHGYYEAQMVWKLHLMQKKYMEEYGIQVILTRSSQTMDRDLYGRGTASTGCDLFISDHSNACGTESVDYPVAYVALTGKSTKIGQQLADVTARVMGTRQGGRISTRANSSGTEYYGVLRGAAAVGTPALILEHSFHTNKASTNWLMNDSNLDKLAKAEADCIAAYFGLAQRPAEPDPAPSKQMYRIRKTWYDAASQIGAFGILDNAKAFADQHTGYTVYDAAGQAVYPVSAPGAYMVRVTVKDLRIRKTPSTSGRFVRYIEPGKYTIVETQDADGHKWGRLKSNAGWIALEYTERV